MLLYTSAVPAQTGTVGDTVTGQRDSPVASIEKKLYEAEIQRIADSIHRADLEQQISRLSTADYQKKADLMQQLDAMKLAEKHYKEAQKAEIDSLRNFIQGFPVTGPMGDTLFLIYSRSGATTASERAKNISAKIQLLYEDDFLKYDSIVVVESEKNLDIKYGDLILMNVSEKDALWHSTNVKKLASEITSKIKASILYAREQNSLSKLLIRIALVLLVLILAWLVLNVISIGNKRLLQYITEKKSVWLHDLAYRDYTFLTVDQEFKLIIGSVNVMRWLVYALLLYITLPIIFSIFPFSRTWADALFQLFWSPFKRVLIAVWNYLPNLFSITVIYFVMKYFNRLVKYIFNEIEAGKLQISGFHSDWALPTYSIVKFLLYAFTFVLIFPYLPGSDSNIFKGVSVFIGVLFSLGSSSAIANIIAGLVITYMRPFRIGDRIKIGEITGDVVEKTLLVTRIRTIKNEMITIPNSAILSGNTTNYSTEAGGIGLILYTNVTIGYDVPWKEMHKALTDAALRTGSLLSEPPPFVLQTSLDDFYVSYQLNAYTREAGKQALIYSELHQNIQDVCNERGIEIMSPHYRAARDGNASTIPATFLPPGYTSRESGVKPS